MLLPKVTYKLFHIHSIAEAACKVPTAHHYLAQGHLDIQLGETRIRMCDLPNTR